MVAQHYRWDFVGLSTDTKPTPATSEKVVDGSTFYCSDTSKLYVFCKDTWYERKALGSGGGGTTYTAGDGIDITNDTISVDTDTIQPKLTAGTGIDITDNTISATGGGGGGGIKFLSASDFNYDDGNTGSFNTVAMWLLDDGFYFMPSDYTAVPVKGGLNGTDVGRFNTDISIATFYCFIKANDCFWMFCNSSSQDPTIYANRPIFFCTINPANGWFSYEGNVQLAKRSELSS